MDSIGRIDNNSAALESYPKAYKYTDRGGIQSIGGYTLGPVIDRGQYRTIKLCRKDSGQELVMKVYRNISLSRQKYYHNLPNGGMVRHTALEALIREVHILQRIGVHPNIVALRDVFYNPDREKTYLVLDCCSGGPVQKWNCIKCRYEPVITNSNVVRSYITDILNGLEYIHSKHVIHRDIKPDNLLIDSQGRVRITMVIGKDDSATTSDSSTLGCTYPFLAPEMCGDDEEEDYSPTTLDDYDDNSLPISNKDVLYKGDIWALGVTLWSMVTGKLPFYSTDLTQLFMDIAHCEVPIDDSEPILFTSPLEVLEKKLADDLTGAHISI
ncbi:Calcium calmodulin-dependent protein kinase kinase 2 [Perkinsus chesapeaki]|uniref:Calcium calmodulin-dependent protein kinase kinase 2 n=1 Tax=Perkinsus chesapeaki TaxID=330153 RepID=A0A7J6MP26_PERCH|nr:Calcium calmodulin-dependent protein kinase kinase 2 [Perkinsus chesapeaki]